MLRDWQINYGYYIRLLYIHVSFPAQVLAEPATGHEKLGWGPSEIEKYLGTQFDETIGRVFLNSDIFQLWDILQNGINRVYGDSNFSEYGIDAVGTLIKWNWEHKIITKLLLSNYRVI